MRAGAPLIKLKQLSELLVRVTRLRAVSKKNAARGDRLTRPPVHAPSQHDVPAAGDLFVD